MGYTAMALARIKELFYPNAIVEELKTGRKGKISSVDDDGNINVVWDDGSSLKTDIYTTAMRVCKAV